MASHQGRLYHCGAVAPKRSTFADANRNRDFRVFSGLFEAMLAGASRGLRRKMADAVRLIELDRAQARRGRSGMGALLDRRFRREERMSSMIPTSGARSITPSPQPTSTTSARPRRCRFATGRDLRVRPRPPQTSAPPPLDSRQLQLSFLSS